MLNTQPEPNTPWLIRTLMKVGLQNQKQAESALLLFVGLCVLFTFWMMIPTKTVPPQNDLQQNPNYEPTKPR